MSTDPAPSSDSNPEKVEQPSSHPDPDAPGRRSRRPVADWGADDLFTSMPRRRAGRAMAGGHSRRPAPSSTTSHQTRRNAESVAGTEPPVDGPKELDAPAVPDSVTVAPSEPSAPVLTVHQRVGGGVQAGPLHRAGAGRAPGPVTTKGIGSRLDRIAGVLFLLGVLLLLLAVATADAAAVAVSWV